MNVVKQQPHITTTIKKGSVTVNSWLTWNLVVELNGISATLRFSFLYSATFPTLSSQHLSRAVSDASPVHSLHAQLHIWSNLSTFNPATVYTLTVPVPNQLKGEGRHYNHFRYGTVSLNINSFWHQTLLLHQHTEGTEPHLLMIGRCPWFCLNSARLQSMAILDRQIHVGFSRW